NFTRIAFLCIILSFSTVPFAQNLNYPAGGFSTFTSTYTDITSTGTSVTMTNNDTGYSNSSIPIGFTFNFNGTSFTNLTMYVDGFVKLGGGTVSWATNMLFTTFAQSPAGGPFNTSASTPVGYAQPQDTDLIFAFGQDLWGAASNAATPQFKYVTTGTTGSRVCTLQWKNMSDKTQCGITSQYDTINFQLKLYEGSNSIEIVFGTWTQSSNTSNARFSAIGLKGNNTGIGSTSICQLLTFTKASSTAWSLAVANSQCTGTPLGNYPYPSNAINYGNAVSGSRPAPDVGRVYHFTPLANNDIAVNTVFARGKIASPFFISDSIRAYITNVGSNTQSSITVVLNISGANSYTNIVTIPTLAGLSCNTSLLTSTFVSFAPFTPTNQGKNIIKVYTFADDNLLNDTATYGMSVSNRYMGYTDTTQGVAQAYGGTVSPNFVANKYKINGTGFVSQIKCYITGNSVMLGDTVCGMITDMSGNILGRSPNYVILSTDLGTYLNFNISIPPVLTNATFLAGIYSGMTSTIYYMGSVQNESPTRPVDTISYWSTSGLPITNLAVGNTLSPSPSLFTYPSYYTGSTLSSGAYPYRFMNDITIDIDTADVGVSLSSPFNNTTIATGAAMPLRAYVKNYGTNFRPSGIGVKYSIDGGTAVGPLSTTVGLNQNDTTSVLFTGTNAITLSTAGPHTIKIFTTLSNDQLKNNDTLVITVNAVTPITTYPYQLTNGILTTWTPINNASALWKQTTATQPNGVSATTVLYADNFNVAVGTEAKMLSPLFSFVGITNPVMHFYVANAPSTTTGKDDTLQVMVSTDGGSTFTAVYSKSSQLSSPTLGTIAAASSYSPPSAATDWRHEAIDLSAYAGSGSVLIGFREKSAGGNSVFIGDIIISNPALKSFQSVTSTGLFTSGIVNLSFTGIGATTGKLALCRYNVAAPSSATPIYNSNSSATTNSGAIFTPTNVWTGGYWTMTYSGNGTGNLPSSSPYYVQINIAGIGGMPRPDSLYVMKRSEYNGSWTALSTSRTGTTLTVGPLTGFCDFSIGSMPAYNALPVTWLNVSATKILTDVNVNWITGSEINSDHFVVERSLDGNLFNPVGELKASGNSSKAVSYNLIDKNVPQNSKTIYYRIAAFDQDGSSSLSKTVTLNLNAENKPVVVYPNPFTADPMLLLNISKPTDVKIVVTDLTGREVLNKTIHAEVNSPVNLNDLGKLDNGYYLLNVSMEGETHSLKINKVE
ncbi:MAG: T9SS type A sorting domain-containing protein, partial [Bacteroidia bacterium]